MKCCASQTTSTDKPVAIHDTATAFEALLFEQALKPVAKPMGFYGDFVVGACANAIARHEHGGLAAHLERLFASEKPT